MHKKLYKAKKNWVIGLIAGSILLLGSATGVNADDTTDTTGTSQTVNTSNKFTESSIQSAMSSNTVKINSNNGESVPSSSKLNDNVNLTTQIQKPDIGKSVGYNVSIKGQNGDQITNSEDVRYYYYYPSSADTQADVYTNGVAGQRIFVDGNTTDSSEKNEGMTASEYHATDSTIKMTEYNNHAISTTLGSDTITTYTHAIKRHGNSVDHFVTIHGKGNMIPNGAFGITIDPDYQSSGVINNDPKLYKKDNYFYYILNDENRHPKWIEVIEPLNGSKMFSSIDGEQEKELRKHKDPILKGQLVSNIINYGDFSTGTVHIIAKNGLNAKIAYREIYYEINKTAKSSQIKVVFLDQTHHMREMKHPFYYKGKSREQPNWDVINRHIPNGYTLSKNAKKSYISKGNVIYVPLTKAKLTVQFINNVTKKIVGKRFEISNDSIQNDHDLNADITNQITDKVPSGYEVVHNKNLIPKHNYDHGVLYIYIQLKGLNPELEGTVDVTQQDNDFLNEKVVDTGKDYSIDKAGDLINEDSGAVLVDPLHYIDLANKISQNGFGADEAEDLFFNLTGTIENYMHAAGVNPELTKKFGGLGVRDILEQAGTTGEDLFDTLKDGINSLNEKGKYYHKYLYNRNKKNMAERKENFLNARKTQMNSIFEGASTVKDGIVEYFQNLGPVGKLIVSAVAVIVMFVIAWMTKYIWRALQGKEMSEVFGLKIKEGKPKKK